MARKDNTEGHVAPADGRFARRRRRETKKEANQTESVGSATPLPNREKSQSNKKSLRQRRAERRRRKLREQGLDPDRPEERVRPMGVVWLSWRWFSGILTFALLIVLYIMLFSDLFIIDSMAIGGEEYLTREFIFQSSGVANQHLFFVDPAEVEARLEENPSIVDAQVFIGWPPNMISIIVQEREPVLIWQQADFRVWVDSNGVVMFQREERPDLVLVELDDNSEDVEPLGLGAQIDRDIIAGALQLKSMYPNIEALMYDPIKGLGYQDGRNWVVWFGVGTNMELKAKVYDRILSVNAGTAFREVDVSDPDHPYFTERFPSE